MPKNKLTDREIRAILRKEAKEDPDGWAALAITAADKARQGLQVAQRGYMSRALRDVAQAEALERQLLARYLDEPAKKNGKTKTEPATPDLPDTEAELRAQLRKEHKRPEPKPTATEAKNAGETNDDPRSSARAQEEPAAAGV